MTREAITEKVENILVQEYDVDKEDINPESKLHDDFDMDSLDSVEFIMRIEKEFSLIIPDSIASDIKTFKEVIDCLEEYVGEK